MKTKIKLCLIFASLALLLMFIGRFVLGCGVKQFSSEDLVVISTSPADKALGVAISAHITATFNKAVNGSSVKSSTFTLSSSAGAVSGQVTYDAESKTATFIPANNLANSTVYTATISSEVMDIDGRSMGAPYSWIFTTVGLNGVLDPAFGDNGVVSSDLSSGPGGTDSGIALAVDSQKRVLVAGFSGANSTIWRFNENGQPDTTFGGTGYIELPYCWIWSDSGNCITLDNNGRILVTGSGKSIYDNKMVVCRFNTDGSSDGAFGLSGVAAFSGISTEGAVGYGIVVDSSNRILVTGTSKKSGFDSDMTVWRIRANGESLDSTFGNNGMLTHDGALAPGAEDSGRQIRIDSQGRIVVAGRSVKYTLEDFDISMAVWRSDDSGHLDTSFSDGTHHGFVVIDGVGNHLALDGSDAVYLTGAGDKVMCIWKLKADGSFDNAFGIGGVQSYEAIVEGASKRDTSGSGIVLDSSGKILVCGKVSELTISGLREKIIIWRCLANGTLDGDFGVNGNTVYWNGIEGARQADDIIIDPDGRVLVSGNEINDKGDSSMIVLRYK